MTSMTNVQGVDPVSITMTSPSSSTTCQQQAAPNQQDLIRLLAQHFNQQPYQSDGPTSRISSTHSTSAATPASNIDLLHQSIAHIQQHPVSHNTLNLINGRVDLATAAAAACLMGSNTNDRTFLAGQLTRFPNQPPLTSGPITTNNQSTTRAALGGYAPIQTRAEPQMGKGSTHSGSPFLGDMSLFNALNCFNMSSDQLMLSLQQQYLIQMASAANRHYEIKPNNANSSMGLDVAPQLQQHHFNQLVQHHAELLQHQQQQQYQRELQINQRGRRHQADRTAGKKAVDLIDPQGDDGRELLKFSINTILGQSSPAARSQERPGSRSPSDYIDALSTQKPADNDSRQLRATQASSPECDANVPTDLSSDSSSTNTPLPQTEAETATRFDHFQSTNTPSTDLGARPTSLVDQVARYHQASTEQHRPSLANQQHPSPLNFLAGSAPFPWTSTARGKPRRGMMRRAVFSDSQRVGLEKRFQLQKYISKPDRKKLAEKLGLRDSQVKIWFQNRRMKWRNSKERELLSAGGSREQTLPTRNNPNPDLSDVGETIKKLSPTSSSHTTS